MADGNIISAGTNVDLSGIQGLKAELAILQEKYRSVSTDIKQSVNRVVDAEKQATDAIAAGHQQLASIISAAAETEKAALTGLITQQDRVTASMVELKAAITPATAAEEENVVATEAMATAHSHAVSEIQATSGALRTLEGTGGIRAAERFLTLLPGLGQALTVAFPVIGALALTESLVKLYEKTDPVIKAEKNLAEVTKTADKEFENLSKTFEKLKLEEVALELSKVAGMHVAAFYSDTSAEDDKARIKYLSDLIDRTKTKIAAEDDLKTFFANPLKATNPFEIGIKFGEIKDAQAQFENLKAYQIEIEVLQEKARVAAEQSRVDIDKANKDKIEEGKKNAREATAAVKKQEADIKDANTNMLADLKSDHELTKAEEIEFWEARLAEVDQFGKRYAAVHTEINRTIGSLIQQADKEADTAAKKAATAKLKTIEDQLKEEGSLYDAGYRLAQARNRQLATENRKAIEQAKKDTEELHREIATQGDAGVSGLETDRAGLTAQKKRADASPTGSTPQAELDYLKALRDIDRQIITEKVQTQAKLIQLDSLGDPSKVQADIQKLIQIQKQGQITMLNDTTSILNQEQAQYKKFFTQLNQEGTNAFNDLLTNGPRKFVQDMNQIWTKMVLDFADKLLLMGLKWVEHEVLKVAATVAGNQAQVASTAAAATQTTAINSAVTLKTITQDAVKAATGAYQAVVGIPIVGPILAPIAAGVAFASVEAFGALASFETGTNYVPQTGLYQLHAGEAVVPKQYNPAAGGSGGGDVHFHGGIQVHAPQAQTPDQIANAVYGKIQSRMRRQNLQPA